MVDEREFLKQYSYKANSNLVLRQDRAPRRDRNVGTGEVEALQAEGLPGRMGDKAQVRRDKPNESGGRRKIQEGAQRKVSGEGEVRRDTAHIGEMVAQGASVVEVANELELDAGNVAYVPTTEVSQKAFESLLSFVAGKLGDQPRDLLRDAADEALATLKDQRQGEAERKKAIEDMWHVKMSPDEYSRLSGLGRQIKDFGDDNGEDLNGQEMHPENGPMEEEAVAVVFDDAEGVQEDEDDGDEFYEQGIDYGDELVRDKGNELVHDIPMVGEVPHDASDYHTEDAPVLLGGTIQSSPQAKTETTVSLHEVDGYWLQRRLGKLYDDAHECQKIAEDVFDILSRDDDDGMCENRLVLLLDRDKFDLISMIVDNRDAIVFGTRLARAENPDERRTIEEEMRASEKGNQLLGTLASKEIHMNAGMLAEDADGLDGKGVESSVVGDGENLRARRLQKRSLDGRSSKGVISNSSRAKRKRVPLRRLDLESLAFQRGGHAMSVRDVKLPTGSEHIQVKDYEEWHIPAIRSSHTTTGKPLIPISAIPIWSQAAFPNTRHLNRMQSIVYPCAFDSDENMLLCAPTGAGKTNVAMLAIMRAIRNEGSYEFALPCVNVADLKSFKVVYVAPMKALVAEVVQNLGKRLEGLGVTVRELTGDVNLSRQELDHTQVIVTTPEKWDVVTRKSSGKSFTKLVSLLIVDEIHLLHDERGPVLEAIVSRMIRNATSLESAVRVVGLSATLPNYRDIAAFLRVDSERGLFHFDSTHRPCPLQQCYIGISSKKALKRYQIMNDLTYQKVKQQLTSSNQVIVFVHSRKETIATCQHLISAALDDETIDLFLKPGGASSEIIGNEAPKVTGRELEKVLQYGLGTHHAGMSREDRSLVESLFENGHLQVLVSTATLAWGVNLPAHAVIIKGTQVYSPEQGTWIELSSMDVMQMMGRAGRPQFDDYGEGIIITSKTDVLYYLSLLNEQLPIESQLVSKLVDLLNAEVANGAVASIDEGSTWLTYTYLYVRMLQAPALYGISVDERQGDPKLERRRAELIHSAANLLHRSGLVQYDQKSGSLSGTNLGRIAADHYVSHQTVCSYVDHMKPTTADVDLLRIFSLSGEFRHLRVREEEKLELARLADRVPIPVKESLNEPTAKVNVLLQAYISRLALDGLALRADMVYVTQSAARLSRALLQIAVQMKSACLVDKCLRLAKAVSARQWASQSPLRQFRAALGAGVLRKIERKDVPFEKYYDLTVAELGELLRDPKLGRSVHRLIHSLPRVELQANVRPLSQSTVEVEVELSPDFRFDSGFHGSGEKFWILIEDADSERLLHFEHFFLRKSLSAETHFLNILIPFTSPQPPHYFLKCISDTWIVPETVISLSFHGLLLPQKNASFTKLLDMRPLSIREAFSTDGENEDGFVGVDSLAYKEAHMAILEYYIGQNRYLTPLESQLFNCMFRTNTNALLATVPNAERMKCAELCIARLFARNPTATVIWVVTRGEATVDRVQRRLATGIGKHLNLLVGKFVSTASADLDLLRRSGSVTVTTSERWDMFTRRWKMKRERKILEKVGLVIVDGVESLRNRHGTGAAATEVICSRMRYIAADAGENGKEMFRIVAISDPIGNAWEIGQWLGVPPSAVFSFHPHDVDAKLKVHITASHNAIGHVLNSSDVLRHVQSAMRRYLVSKQQQTVVFVSSRKAAKYAAMEIANSVAEADAPQTSENSFLKDLTIESLRECVAAGTGYVHDGMHEKDRRLVVELFKAKLIFSLVISAEHVWEHDVPSAELLVIVGTSAEESGGLAVCRAEYTPTDLFRMMFAHACSSSSTSRHVVLVTEQALLDHYKLHIEGPLPVESQLPRSLSDHMNAEIVAGVIETKQDAVDYLTWTFFYHRLPRNPNYYGMKSLSKADVSKHLSEVVDGSLAELEASKCVATEGDDDVALGALNLGIIASHYYVQHSTVELFASSITPRTRVRGLLDILSLAAEFGDVPVRIGDEEAIRRLSGLVPLPLDTDGNPSFSSSHVKTHILLQAHLSRHKLTAPLQQDQARILPIAARLLRVIVDVISSAGWLKPALAAVDLTQMIIQGMWDLNAPLLQLPHVDTDLISILSDKNDVSDIFDFLDMDPKERSSVLSGFSNRQVLEIASACDQFPDLQRIEVQSIEYVVDEDGECVVKVTVELRRQADVDMDSVEGKTDAPAPKTVPTVSAPHFPEVREEGWWIIIGDKKTNSVLTLKHVALKQKALVKLEFLSPVTNGKYELELYLRSNSYVDCDQDDSFEINLANASGVEDTLL